MTYGIAINRQWIYVLRNGSIVLDWGDGRAVDLMGGEFIPYEPGQFSHPVQDDELETLKHMGRVSGYDKSQVYLTSMPELPARE
jgi:hypothetical protein